MSQLRQKFGSTMASRTHQTARMSALSTHVAQAADANHLTANWLRRLGQTSNTPDSREAHSQLSSILDFYNVERKAKEMAPIDWEGFRERIHTDGVVDKIHAKYDNFMESEYKVESAVGRVGVASEKIKALDTALQYNFMLYFVHWMEHLKTLETMNNIGDVQSMSILEMASLNPHMEVCEMQDREIGDISPENFNEDGYFSRICTQFNWGTRYTPPF